MRRHEAASLLRELLGPDLFRSVDHQDGWPMTGDVWDGRAWRAVDVYVGVIGSSGRDRVGELRMQNPTSARPVESTPGRTTLLLGLHRDDSSHVVLVAWDAARRFGRTTRYSLFVPEDVVRLAAQETWVTHRAAAGEEIVALVPSALPRLVAQLAEAPPEEHGLGDPTKMTEKDEDAQDLDFSSLAEHLAALSDAEVLPTGFDEASGPFEPEDVDWSSNEWLARLADVQSWLNLDEPLDLAAGAQATLDSLFQSLGASTPEDCYVIRGGVARLTAPGIDRLSNRFDTAKEHKDAFSQAIDDGSTRRQATKIWRELWEDEPAVSDNTPPDVHASVTTWRIREFRDQAEEGELVLNPSYQRDSVWPDKMSVELIDSILRGIPLPSIILNQRRESDKNEIVDGKQRLTAILRFIGQHPDGVAFAKRKSEEAGVDFGLFRKDFKKWRGKVNRSVGISSSEEGADFLPFQYKLPPSSRADDPLAPLHKKYYCEIRSERVTIQGKEERIQKLFESSATKYELPVILYEDTDIRQIHNVFGLYNRQGKKLNATEVRNAIYHHLTLTRLLLLLAGDSEDVAALAPYLAGTSFDFSTIPNMLESIAVGKTRFNRTKVTSWVTAIIMHPIESRKGVITTPGSTKLIESMMLTISDNRSHPLRGEETCRAVANSLREGAHRLTELRTMEAFDEHFNSRGEPSEKWADLPTVAAWTACALAAIGGFDFGRTTRSAVREATASIQPPEKQQAKTQWIYLARAILLLLQSMGVERSALSKLLTKQYDYDCLVTLDLMAALTP